MELLPYRREDEADLIRFLTRADLTLSGLDGVGIRIWIDRGDDGAIRGTTGYELSDDRRHALIRSVAIDPSGRREGRGTMLARAALARATADGARTAWLFSRRSGPFWQRLGFQPADRDELAHRLSNTHQVALFRRTGKLDHEIAWSRPLEVMRR